MMTVDSNTAWRYYQFRIIKLLDGSIRKSFFARQHVSKFSGEVQRKAMMTDRTIEPIHPGEILIEEFLVAFRISRYGLAKDINVSPRRVNETVRGKGSITAGTALRFSRYLGLSERLWLNLQSRYYLEVEKERLKGRIEAEVNCQNERLHEERLGDFVISFFLNSVISRTSHWSIFHPAMVPDALSESSSIILPPK